MSSTSQEMSDSVWYCFLQDAEKRFSELFDQLNFAKDVYDSNKTSTMAEKHVEQRSTKVSSPQTSPDNIQLGISTHKSSPRKVKAERERETQSNKSHRLVNRPSTLPSLVSQQANQVSLNTNPEIQPSTSSLRVPGFKTFPEFLAVMEEDDKIQEEHERSKSSKKLFSKNLSVMSLPLFETGTIQRGLSNPLTASENKACLDSINNNAVFENNQRHECSRTGSILMKRKALKDRKRYGSILNGSASRLIALQKNNIHPDMYFKRASRVSNNIKEIIRPNMDKENMQNYTNAPTIAYSKKTGNVCKKSKVASHCISTPHSEYSQFFSCSKKKHVNQKVSKGTIKIEKRGKKINVTPNPSNHLLNVPFSKVNASAASREEITPKVALKNEIREAPISAMKPPCTVGPAVQVTDEKVVSTERCNQSIKPRNVDTKVLKTGKPQVPKGYELPTLASQQKRTDTVISKPNRGYIPFVGGTATSKSHNIGISLQSILSVIKLGQKDGVSPLAVAEDVLKESSLPGMLRRPIASFLSTMSTGHSNQVVQCPAMLNLLNKSKCLTASPSVSAILKSGRPEDLWSRDWGVVNSPSNRCICFPTRKSVSASKVLGKYWQKADCESISLSSLNRSENRNVKNLSVLQSKIQTKKEMLTILYPQLESLFKRHKRLCSSATSDGNVRDQMFPQIKAAEEEFFAKRAEVEAVKGILEELLTVKKRVLGNSSRIDSFKESGGQCGNYEDISKQARLLHTLQGLHGKLQNN